MHSLRSGNVPVMPGDARAGQPRAIAGARSSRRGLESERMKNLEDRVFAGDALDMGVARVVLESGDFERIARAISRRHAADPDVVESRALYARKLERQLAGNRSTLSTFECGLGYCLGEVAGSLGSGGEGALADTVDAGAFALLPWET